jgi:hypothetical protein
MLENFDLSVIYVREDGSYVINRGLYHVPNEGDWAELWKEVNTYAKEHPELIQAEPQLEEYVPTFAEAKESALSKIDDVTSKAILAGFDYEINGEILHFSYDGFDQLNFNDTFNGVAMKKLMGIETLPELIEWNGWRNHTKDYKGDLVRLVLDVDAFIALYVNGALIHKSMHMDICGKHKEAIKAAKTVAEIEALLAEWNIR